MLLLLLRRCSRVVTLPAPPLRLRSSPLFSTPLSTVIMPPRKRTTVAPSASASSGSDFEAPSPAPKAKKAKASSNASAAAASKKKSPASKNKKSPVDDGPKGLAPGWVKYGPYVIAKTYGSPAASSKIAAFDLDGTLVVEGASWRRERSLGPAKPGDFVFFRRDAPEALRACVERGERLAVFSNQGTIRGALDGKNAWKQTTRMDLVQKALGGLPMTVVFATAAKADNDPHRKPGRGMWDLFASRLASSSAAPAAPAPDAPDASLSTYVGDAAGRLGDFADSDKGFAEAAGLAFRTPEEFFGGPTDVAEFDSGWRGVVGHVEGDDDDDEEEGGGGGGDGAGPSGGGVKAEDGGGGGEEKAAKKKKESHNAPILAFFSKLCDAYKADAAARGEEGKKNLGFKLGAAAKAAASFRALPVEVESIEQVKALVKAKELPGVGKASVERLQAWFETGTCDMFAALESQRAALADRAGSAAAGVAAAVSSAVSSSPKKEEEKPAEEAEPAEENYGALAFA